MSAAKRTSARGAPSKGVPSKSAPSKSAPSTAAAATGAAHPLVAVYADESCLGNGRAGDTPGGAGGLVEWRHPKTGEILRWDWWVSERDTTNNRMALRSVIETFDGLSQKERTFSVVFTSDSKYVVDGMTSWVPGWMARGWTRKTGPIENLELWQAAVAAAAKHERMWRWVRGHNGHPQNEYANHLATRAAADQTQSGGFVPSGFDAWVAAERARGKLRGAFDPFPAAEAFAAAPVYPQVRGMTGGPTMAGAVAVAPKYDSDLDGHAGPNESPDSTAGR